MSAQTVGTFRWQLQPFCNVVTVSVLLDGGVYTLDGYDDQCSASDHASVVGTAFLNPDGSVGMGLSAMTAPGPAPVAVQARVQLATASGTWHDSVGNSGAFVLTPGPGTGGPLRPVPPNGVREGSVTATELAPGAVGSGQIAAGAVGASHLAPGAIAAALGSLSTSQIAPEAITAVHIAPGVVGAEHVAERAVGALQIAPGAIEAAHFAPGAVNATLGPITSGHIAPGTILSSHIAAGAVLAAHLAPGAVGSIAIAPGAIGAPHLAPGAVGAPQIAPGVIGASPLAPGLLQSLFVGTCPASQYLRGLTATGAVICEPFFVAPSTTRLDGLDSAGHWASIAIGADGLPVISSWDQNANTLRVTTCGNPACTAGGVSVLPHPAILSVGFFSSIAVGPDGLPVIAHYDQGAFALRVTKCGNPACTADNVSTLVDDPEDAVGFDPSVAIGADGLPVISHSNASASALRVTKCGNAACTAGNVSTTVADPLVEDGVDPSLAIGADGLPVISHFAWFIGALRVTRCGNAACTNGNSTTTVDAPDAALVGQFSSIAVAPDGLPVISHFDSTSERLRVTKCGDPMCTVDPVTTRVVDPDYPIEFYTSMAIGIDGLPVIGARDLVSGALRVTRCGSATCAAGNVTTIIDDAVNRVGTDASIAIGADGVPVISHMEEPGGLLRVTKCGTQSCR